MASSLSNIPFPSALNLKTSCMAVDWKRFKGQWANYEIATDLAEKLSKKRAAVFLACIGTEAYELYQTMEFTGDDDQDIEKIIDAFEKHCVGEVNITYERYNFNQRKQEIGESFDVFLSDLRRLARSCDYGDVEESIIRDRIVVGIREDATRRKLLQTRKLDLKSAIDICRASELASKQLRAMTAPDEVNTLRKTIQRPSSISKDKQRNSGRREANASGGRRCKYCDKVHEPSKEACVAYGATCRKCLKKITSKPFVGRSPLVNEISEFISYKTKNYFRCRRAIISAFIHG